MERATLVAVIDREMTATGAGAVSAASWAEVRPEHADSVRAHFAGKILLSEPSPHGCYDYVNLEANDLVPAVLDAIPEEKRVITWRGRAADLESFAPQLAHRAALYRVIVEARDYRETLLPLQLLKSLGRRDVIAWADGPLGVWTRLVAPQFGAPFVFSNIENTTPTIAQLVTDYGFPQFGRWRELFGIAGDPIFGSLSPRLHNAAFRDIGRPALYVPFHVPSFEDFWNEMIASGALDDLGLPLSALCVVSPHKETAIAAAGTHTPMVGRARATNFVTREGEEWTADTTDSSVVVALQERGVDVWGQTVAVIGCGGSGRTIAAALQQAGADVTLVNRGLARGLFAEGLLDLPFLPLAGFSADRFSIVINATPVGRDGECVPFAIEGMRKDAVVVDLAYGAQPTPLISRTRARGRVVIDGRDILMKQAMRQFHVMTGREMPLPIVQAVMT